MLSAVVRFYNLVVDFHVKWENGTLPFEFKDQAVTALTAAKLAYENETSAVPDPEETLRDALKFWRQQKADGVAEADEIAQTLKWLTDDKHERFRAEVFKVRNDFLRSFGLF